MFQKCQKYCFSIILLKYHKIQWISMSSTALIIQQFLKFGGRFFFIINDETVSTFQMSTFQMLLC